MCFLDSTFSFSITPQILRDGLMSDEFHLCGYLFHSLPVRFISIYLLSFSARHKSFIAMCVFPCHSVLQYASNPSF